MNAEQIQALKTAHPQEFATKCGAGLTEAQAAESIQAQLAHDAANPPGPIALGKARNLADLADSRFTILKGILAEAAAAIAEAARLNPDLPGSDLPSLPDLGHSDRANEDADTIINLETELAELKAAHNGLKLDHETLTKERDELKEARDLAVERGLQTADSLEAAKKELGELALNAEHDAKNKEALAAENTTLKAQIEQLKADLAKAQAKAKK